MRNTAQGTSEIKTQRMQQANNYDTIDRFIDGILR
jgi:hypothetical protein